MPTTSGYEEVTEYISLADVPAALREALKADRAVTGDEHQAFARYTPPGLTQWNADLMPFAPPSASFRTWGEYVLCMDRKDLGDADRPPGYRYLPTLPDYDLRLVLLSDALKDERYADLGLSRSDFEVGPPPPLSCRFGFGTYGGPFIYSCTAEVFELVRKYAGEHITWRHVPLPGPSEMVGDLYLFEIHPTKAVDPLASAMTWKTLSWGTRPDDDVYPVRAKMHLPTFYKDAVEGRHLVSDLRGWSGGSSTYVSPELDAALRGLGATTRDESRLRQWFDGEGF